VITFPAEFFLEETGAPFSSKKNLVETDKNRFQFRCSVRGGKMGVKKKLKLKNVFHFQFRPTVRNGLNAALSKGIAIPLV
jgi:hypothetical protein